MPDQLNKQTLINLLIDSPLREPIKINLIDIVNNTSDPDLPKIFPTIVKELEIFQKATDRRLKLADETIAKLGGNTSSSSTEPASPVTPPPSTQPAPPQAPVEPPTPPLPTPSTTPPEPAPVAPSAAASLPPLSVPPLDLPPLPQIPTPPTTPPATTQAIPEPSLPTPPTPPIAAPTTPEPLPPLEPIGNTNAGSSDEDALAEIQKELESLKSGISADANPTVAPPTPPVPQS